LSISLSFGIVLYAMTMGRLPFELSSEQPNIQSLIRKVSSGITSTQRREMCLRLSWDCHSLIQKCLELNPLTRISVKEITFDNWLTGGGSGRVDFPNPVLDQALLKDVAADLKKTLKIQLSEIEILSFVSKRPFRTTGSESFILGYILSIENGVNVRQLG
jgi:serine/threonine protein kinase